MRTIEPMEVDRLIKAGALLVDVREADEHAREHIAGAELIPLSRFPERLGRPHSSPVIFHCGSGARTAQASEKLARAVDGDAYLLAGGLDAWKRAGLAVVKNRSQPIAIMRQVQLAAGSLVLLGVALGGLVNPAFYAISGFVGAGLVFAGASGTCTMARILSFAPWNRKAAADPRRGAG